MLCLKKGDVAFQMRLAVSGPSDDARRDTRTTQGVLPIPMPVLVRARRVWSRPKDVDECLNGFGARSFGRFGRFRPEFAGLGTTA